MNRQTPQQAETRHGRRRCRVALRRGGMSLVCVAVTLGGLLLPTADAVGQSRVGPNPLGSAAAPLPEEVQRLAQQGGVTQRLGAQLPLDTPFVDERGRPVTLGDYFRGDKPVVLEFAYFECPLLCPMMMRGIQDALRGVSASSPVGGAWIPGEDFDVVTISINPDDTPVAAAEKKQELRDRFAEGEPGREVEPRPDLAEAAADGWHFLTGREVDIRRAADAAG
ncbi:MAG: SCO family protein, partial [Planctomycetota bacterium]